MITPLWSAASAVVAGIIGLIFRDKIAPLFKPAPPAQQAVATETRIAQDAANTPSQAQAINALEQGDA